MSFGSLAQLVEQRTLNPFVECSIHSRPTNMKTRELFRVFFVAACMDFTGGFLYHRACCLRIGGSPRIAGW